MPISNLKKIDPHDIGKYPRSYDDIEINDENDEDEEEAERLAEVLKWTTEETYGEFQGRDKKAFNDLLRIGAELGNVDKLSAMRAIHASPFKDTLIDRAIDLLKDVYYGLRDVLAGKKVKTALTVLVGIGAGAAAGAALGTLVLPGIGTAGGAIVGAASGILATVGPIIGGTIGLSIIGGVIGGWIGKFASKKIYRDEHRFGLSKRVTTKLKERCDVRTKTAELINGYLYNRQKTAKNTILKRVYKDLRKEGIHHAEPAVMEKIALFFCHELTLLQRETDVQHHDPALQHEMDVVIAILESLSHSKKFPKETHRRIRDTLQAFKGKEQASDVLKAPSLVEVLDSKTPVQKKAVRFSSDAKEALHGVRFAEVRPLNPEQLKNVNKKFQEAIKHSPYHIKHVEVKQKKHDKDRTLEFRCKLSGDQKVKIIFQQEKVSASAYTAGVYVEKTNLKKENQGIVLDLLVKGIEALQSVHQDITQHQILTIDADGDDLMAIQFMVAALKAKMPVQLNDQEYPNTPAMNARRVKIELEAHRLAHLPEEPRQVAAKKPIQKPSKSK